MTSRRGFLQAALGMVLAPIAAKEIASETIKVKGVADGYALFDGPKVLGDSIPGRLYVGETTQVLGASGENWIAVDEIKTIGGLPYYQSILYRPSKHTLNDIRMMLSGGDSFNWRGTSSLTKPIEEPVHGQTT